MVLNTPSALPLSFRNVPPTVILADTLIVTALLLGVVGVVGVVGRLRRRAHSARHGR